MDAAHYVQITGRQAIHIAALSGQKLIVKTLVEKYRIKVNCIDMVSAIISNYCMPYI